MFALSFLLILSLGFMSFILLLTRFRNNDLITPVSGLHLQVFILFFIGGMAYLFFPSGDPSVAEGDVPELIIEACIPFVVGYSLVFFGELYIKKINKYKLSNGYYIKNLSKNKIFSKSDIILLAVLSIFGITLGTDKLIFLVYLGNFYYPTIFIFLLSYAGFDTTNKLIVTISFMSFAVFLGFYSPWRSILVILLITILMVVAIRAPKRMPIFFIGGIFFMSILLPFQMLKKDRFDEFLRSPVSIISESLSIESLSRVTMIGEFIAVRVDYMRELIYVYRDNPSGLRGGRGGEYIESLYQQVIPRFLWPGKPAVADNVTFYLPRELGLVQFEDADTSWALNMFAEATYFFGGWCLLWFMPIVFSLATLLENVIERIYKHLKSKILASITLFYLILSSTTVTFMTTYVLSVFFIVYVLDKYAFRYSGPSEIRKLI